MLDNFITAWQGAGLASALVNSLLVTVASVALIVVISALASYPLARVSSAWSRGMGYMLFMLGLLLASFQLVFIPLYQTFNSMKILGRFFWPLIILYAGHQAPFSVFLYTSFLRALPPDFEEAAEPRRSDAVPDLLERSIFPLLTPVTGTVVILNAVLVRNDFMSPLLYLGGSREPDQTGRHLRLCQRVDHRLGLSFLPA